MQQLYETVSNESYGLRDIHFLVLFYVHFVMKGIQAGSLLLKKC